MLMGNWNKSNHGEERRFIDDMSELDIELQKQTIDVSVTEMMQEVDNMQKYLKNEKNSNMLECTEGEQIDGK